MSDVREEFTPAVAPPQPSRRARIARAFLPETDQEATFLVGLGLLAVGLYFAWPPGALIVPGSILTLVGLLSRGER
jgi:hypothetical protein